MGKKSTRKTSVVHKREGEGLLLHIIYDVARKERKKGNLTM